MFWMVVLFYVIGMVGWWCATNTCYDASKVGRLTDKDKADIESYKTTAIFYWVVAVFNLVVYLVQFNK